MKKKIVFLSLFLLTILVFSQTPRKLSKDKDPWTVFNEAQCYYEKNDYSNAFRTASKALEYRQKECEWQLYVINNAIEPLYAKRIGDNISDILPKLKERESYQAVGIIKQLQSEMPNKNNDSLSILLNYIEKRKNFPEAEMILAQVYKIEGEYTFAQNYLLKALQAEDLLNIPAQKYDILYDLADIAINKGNKENYEKYLLLIIASDGLYKGKTLTTSMLKMIKENDNDLMDKYFSMYRDDSIATLTAFMKLSDLYISDNDVENALTMSLYASIISFSRIISVINQRDSDFIYRSFKDTMKKVTEFPDIEEWMEKKNIWRTFYITADLLYKRKNLNLSKQIFSFLSIDCPKNDIKNISKKYLEKF